MKEIPKKQNRRFSTAFKREKVKQLESGRISTLQLSRVYDVSTTAIYKWKRKYGKTLPAGERMVVEKESEGQKLMELLKRVSELEGKVGRQHLEIDYLEKIIEYGSEFTNTDIKKKFESK